MGRKGEDWNRGIKVFLSSVYTIFQKNLANPSQYSEKLALKEGQVGSNQKQLEKYFKMHSKRPKANNN